MTNEQIKARIPHIKEQVHENETDFRTGVITCHEYWKNNYYLMAETNHLIEQAEENERRERFDAMMGNPIKIIEGWFK